MRPLTIGLTAFCAGLAVLHLIRSAEGGIPALVIATVSAAGLLTMPGAAAYSATKHAALAHAEWLSMTYGGRGITVQAVCPLGVRTDLVDLSRPQTAIVLGHTLIGAEDVADTVVEAMADDRFLILPHTEVAGFYAGRAADTDRWLAGMRRIQSAIDAAESEAR